MAQEKVAPRVLGALDSWAPTLFDYSFSYCYEKVSWGMDFSNMAQKTPSACETLQCFKGVGLLAATLACAPWLAPLGPDKSPGSLKLLSTPSIPPLSDLAPSLLAIGWHLFLIQGIRLMAPISEVATLLRKTYEGLIPSDGAPLTMSSELVF